MKYDELISIQNEYNNILNIWKLADNIFNNTILLIKIQDEINEDLLRFTLDTYYKFRVTSVRVIFMTDPNDDTIIDLLMDYPEYKTYIEKTFCLYTEYLVSIKNILIDIQEECERK